MLRVLAIVVVGFAAAVTAEPAGAQPAGGPVVTTPAASAQTTRTNRPRREGAAVNRGQPNQPRRARAAAPQNDPQSAAQRPAGGRLDLDLRPQRPAQPATTQRAGDAFATSGPYASPAQMQRYTGRRQINMPQAPITLFGNQQPSTATGVFQPR